MFSPSRGMRLFISQSLKRVHNYRKAKAGQCGREAAFFLSLSCYWLCSSNQFQLKQREALCSRRSLWIDVQNQGTFSSHHPQFKGGEVERGIPNHSPPRGGRCEMQFNGRNGEETRGSEIKSGARLSHVTHCDPRGSSHGMISAPLPCHWHFLFHAQLQFNLLIAILCACWLFVFFILKGCHTVLCQNLISANLAQPQTKPISSLKLCLTRLDTSWFGKIFCRISDYFWQIPPIT